MNLSKKSVTNVFTAACITGSLAFVQTAQAEDQVVLAKVLNATPVTETVQTQVPRRVCHEEQVVTQQTKSYTPSILGGVIGAVVGSRFGGGKGKTLATVGGAALGASVGNDTENRARRKRGHTAVVENCHNEPSYDYENRITGYRVTYEYNGETYMTHTSMDPGKTIPLHVHLQPAG